MKRINYTSISLLCTLVWAGCSHEESQDNANEKAVKVEIRQVGTVSVEGTGHFSGTVEEKNGTALSFATVGTIRTMNVRLGDRVSKGQLIGTLDDTSARSSHTAAQATLAQAEDAYRRMKELHDKGSLPEIKWVEIQSKLKQARSMETLAKKQLDDCRLTAPFAGIISSKTGEAGQNVMPGMAVAQLVSATGQQVKIAVPEAEIGNITVGQKASVAIPALKGKRYEATVTERGVTANALSRSYEVKLKVDDADDSLLPGMVAEVTLTENNGQTACIIPLHIVQLDEQNRNFVWTEKDGKAVKRFITCGDFAGNGVIVTQGLQPGDNLIVKGQHKVCEGTAIQWTMDN